MALIDLLPLQNRLVIVRHGESEANVAGLISSDPSISCTAHGLTAVGFEQARSAAEPVRQIAGQSPIRVFASDFLRTRHTAEALCQALGQDVDQITYDVRLRERYFGDFNGASSENYQLVWNEDDSSMHHTFRNVESVASVLSRAVSLLSELNRSNIGDCFVLVSHGDTLQILQAFFAGIPPNLHRSLPHLKNCEVRDLSVWVSRAVESIDPDIAGDEQ